jgi:hypothetical protein
VEDGEWLTVISKSEDEEDSDNVLNRNQLTTVLKKKIQMTDDLLDNFFEVNHVMDRCLKFKHEVAVVMVPQKGVCKEECKGI